MNTLDKKDWLQLAELPITIKYKDQTGSFPCRIFFDLNLDNTIVIEPKESICDLCQWATGTEPFKLFLPNVSEPVDCYAADSQISVSENGSECFFRFSPHHSNIITHCVDSLILIKSGIINFAHYWIQGPNRLSFQLIHEDWIFDFTPVSDLTIQYPLQIQNEEYRFTHHLSIERQGKRTFSSREAVAKLDLLGDFLSFCRGFWVSTALTSGINEHGIASMHEWGTRKVSPTKVSYNWLDFHNGNCMTQLFPKFAELMVDLAWKDAIQHALYWYIRSDTSLVGPDGSCLLLQSALERLAWHLLVRDRQSLSEEGFHKLPAADQLRLLLSTLRIPLTIPTGLVSLKQISKELNWQDGPQAFVGVRNRLVHPPKLASKPQKLPYYEAYVLGKWYVELAILSACGYQGKYSNRTHLHRWVGEVEDVPWTNELLRDPSGRRKISGKQT